MSHIMYLAVHKFNISILATFTGLRTKTNTQAEACMQAHLKAVEQEHPDERLIFCLTDQGKKSKCAAEDKHCSLSSVEVKETSAVFALWFEMVSVGNSPFSQIGLDVVSIYVFASCQDSLRKWKCSKMLAECVGTGACLSICIHVCVYV